VKICQIRVCHELCSNCSCIYFSSFYKGPSLSTQFKIDSQSKKNVGIWNELLGFKVFESMIATTLQIVYLEPEYILLKILLLSIITSAAF